MSPPVGWNVPLPSVGWEVGACDLVRVGCAEGVERPESVGSEADRPPENGSWVGCALSMGCAISVAWAL